MWYDIQAVRGQLIREYPGVAKFGIALEWGSRGRWFESSHSDQELKCIISALSFLPNFGVKLEALGISAGFVPIRLQTRGFC